MTRNSGLVGRGLRPAVRRAFRFRASTTDPRQLAQVSRERVVFHYLRASGALGGLYGKRVLEIGPKHGMDSQLLASLEPSELVLVELPEKRPVVETWLADLSRHCRVTYVEGDVLELTADEVCRLGSFDLVWCLGVLYHNVEQYRLLKLLYEFCGDGARLVIESATARSRIIARLNAVELHWPRTYRGVPSITHIPSRSALESWLEMVGFTDVQRLDVYSRKLARDRAAFIAKRTRQGRPYVGYGSEPRSSCVADPAR